MTSQIRVDEITNRSGLGTVTIYDNGFEFTGVTTFTEDVDITGGLTIGGVLTYEDVTNIDSVGVVTARGGLDVSDTGTPVNIDSTNSGLNKIHFKTGGTTSGYLGNNSTYFFSLSDSSGNQRVRHANSGLYQVLDTSGNVIHQMSSTGKIGIGTAPVGDLTVLTTNNGYVDINGSGGNGAEVRFLKKTDRSQTYTIQNNGGSNELVQHVLAHSSGRYSWSIGGTERLRIASDGAITVTSDGSDNDGANITLKHANNNTTDVVSSLIFSNNGGEVARISGRTDGANNNGGITFHTDNAGTTGERLRITSDGKVLINSTDNSDAQLLVKSADKLHPALKLDGLSGNGFSLIGDEYQTDESHFTMGIAYSAGSLVTGWGVKVSPTANNEYLSSQDTYSTKHSATIHDTNGWRFLSNSTSQTVTTDSVVSLTEKIRITPDGKMGVGTASPNHKLTLHNSGTGTFDALNITSGLTNSVGLQLGINSASNAFFWHTANGGIQFATNNVERMRVTNNGITFNGDTAAANALDDYEEGFFTPTIYQGADNGSGGAPSFSIQAGRYIKIGRKVHCDIYLRFASGDLSTGSHARIGNLPFAMANESYGNVGPSNLTRGGGLSTFQNTTSDLTSCYGNANTTNFYLYKDGGTSFIFGGSNNANLSGLYWIGIFEYICTA